MRIEEWRSFSVCKVDFQVRVKAFKTPIASVVYSRGGTVPCRLFRQGDFFNEEHAREGGSVSGVSLNSNDPRGADVPYA